MRKRNWKAPCRKIVLRLPDLDQAKSSVLNSLRFAMFEAKLQIRDAAIRRLAML